MVYKKKRKQSDFEFLVELKAKMKNFMNKEAEIRAIMDTESNERKFKKLQKELDEHLKSFKFLESALVKAEERMINLERGLYKGVGINVRDKELKKIPIYLKFNSFSHIGYTGTTRVGKTKNMINDARQLIEKGWDVIIIDPKGGEDQEILTEVIQSCLKHKRAEDFHYLSPAFPDESEYVNILFGMGDDEVASLMKIMASSGGDGGDEFFTDVVFENTLAVAKGLRFIQEATDPSGEYTRSLENKEIKKYEKLKNIKDVNKNFKESNWNKTNDPNELNILTKRDVIENDYSEEIDSSTSFYKNRSMMTFKTLDAYTTHSSLTYLKAEIEQSIPIPPIEKIGKEKYLEIQGLKEEALSILNKVLAIDEAKFANISKSHSVLLSQLVYGDIGKVFNGTKINPLANRILSKDKGLVSVIQPFPMKYKSISNKTIMAILKMVESLMGLVGSTGRGIKRKLVIMIDEAGAVLYKGIEELFNKAGGLNTSLFVYTQSYEDYKLSVGETNANVIMDNVNTPITMRMNNEASCERAAKSLGTLREHQSMYMSTSGDSGRFSVGSQDVQIALPEDISSLSVGTGYMRHNGETYIVDFPYIKGLDSSPVKMPVLDNERIRREMADMELVG